MIVEIFLRNSDFSSPDGFVMVSCNKTNPDLTSPDGFVAQSPVLSSLHWKEFFLEKIREIVQNNLPSDHQNYFPSFMIVQLPSSIPQFLTYITLVTWKPLPE